MTRPFRVAIVGAGPAGIYGADLMTKAERDFDLSIDLFDRLPTPFGLVRYGVAPDHPRIKGIINALIKVLDRGDIRLFTNVEYGVDLHLEELTDRYDAVIFSTGCFVDAELDLSSEEHTSELQSRGHLVCRLLLEKKNRPSAANALHDA